MKHKSPCCRGELGKEAAIAPVPQRASCTQTELEVSKLCLHVPLSSVLTAVIAGGCVARMKEVSFGLPMALVVNLAEDAAFINDLSAKCTVVKPAVAVELGGTERNEQQRRR